MDKNNASEHLYNFLSKQIDLFIVKFDSISIINIIIVIIIVATVSFLSFKVFLLSNVDYENIEKYLDEMKKIKEDNQRLKYYREFVCLYSLLTGIIATSLTCVQFNGDPNISTAVFYGVIGPYVLRDKLYSSLTERTESATKEMLKETRNRQQNSFQNLVKTLRKEDKK